MSCSAIITVKSSFTVRAFCWDNCILALQLAKELLHSHVFSKVDGRLFGVLIVIAEARQPCCLRTSSEEEEVLLVALYF